MNILYFIPKISKEHGGIYQYSFNLLSELGCNENTNHYYVQIEVPDESYLEICEKHNNLHLISGKRAKEPLLSKLIRGGFEIINKALLVFNNNFKFKIRSELKFLINRYKIDIVHCPHQTLPLRIEVPSIVTLHDIQELHYPEFFTSEDRKIRAIDNHNSVNEASAIIVSYKHIKDDIIKYFGIPGNKIHVQLLNMNNLWFNNIETANEFNINPAFENYILYPAATWKHKNHEMLLKAIHQLKKDKNIVVNLICTGHKNDHFKEIENIIYDLNLAKQVVFTGIVSDIELYNLYKKAKAVVIPTLYEAGSFPLYESMFLNIPVICSNVTSLPETIGDTRFVFNPTDISDIANKIIKITTDETYIQDNLSTITARLACFKNQPIALFFDSLYLRLVKYKK